MRRGNRTISVSGMVLVGLVGLVVAGCELGSTHTPPPPPQTLNLTWITGGGTDITTMDPDESSDTSSTPIVSMVFDGLVTLNSQMQVVNWGADQVTPSADGLTYVFHLRPGQKFSDGTPVKASDYAYSMNRSENPCVASPVNYYLWALVDAEKYSYENCDQQTGVITPASWQNGPVVKSLIGDSILPDDMAGTLTVKLAAPAGYFLDVMTYSTSYALEASAVTGSNEGSDEKWLGNLATGPTGQGGSGMFYVAKWDRKTIVQLKANPNWWGISAGMKPKLSEVDYHLFADAGAEYKAFNNDTSYGVDQDIPMAELASAKQQSDFHNGPYLGYEGIAMNFKVPPFDNYDARAAFCLALNRDQINDTLFKGADIPTWHLVPQGMPGYNPNLIGLDGAPLTGDPALARLEWQKYLVTLGGKPVPPIQFTYNAMSQPATAFAIDVTDTWKQVLGANAQMTPMQFRHTLRDQEPNRVQLYRWAWIADYPDPQDFLTLLYTTSSMYNQNNSGSPQIDALMAQADRTLDPSVRMYLYNEAEQKLIDNVSDCPLVQLALNYRVRSSVRGYVLDPQGNVATPDWPSVAITG